MCGDLARRCVFTSVAVSGPTAWWWGWCLMHEGDLNAADALLISGVIVCAIGYAEARLLPCS